MNPGEKRGLRGVALLKKVYSHRLFRFILSGSIATGVDLSVFWLFYNLVFLKQNVPVLYFTLSAYTAAIVISYSCGAVSSFTVNKFFVFADARSWKQQILRFIPVNVFGFIANLLLLKLLIEQAHFWPTFARALAALTVAFVTFNLHKYFTFRR